MISSQQVFAQAETAITEIDAICATHGAYRARQMDWSFLERPPTVSGCPLCAAERARVDAERTAAREASERALRVAGLLRRSCIPARFSDRTIVGYRATVAAQQRALTIAQRYVETWADQVKRGGSLVLTGSPGTGKTHIACAIAAAVIEQHLSEAMYATVLNAMRHIKSTYNRESTRTETQAINDFLSPDLLVLDEVGVQFGTEHEKTLLFEILNERYANCSPVILISNLDAGALESFLGQRLMDRYRECGVVLAFDWASHRGVAP
ncbi:MAG: ATP-binding protein [Bradyrhizobium sp.]|nr:ATP-binding protein [Bradyrhizobium sp.]